MILSREQYENEIINDNYTSQIREDPRNNLWFEWEDILSIRIQEKDKNKISKIIQDNWIIDLSAIESKFRYFTVK